MPTYLTMDSSFIPWLQVFLLATSLASFPALAQQLDGQPAPIENLSIRRAVVLWDRDPVAAEAEFGHIEEWNTENVTSFRYLFQDVTSEFDFNLKGWDTSKVTSLFGMAQNAPNFDAKIADWDISRVKDITRAFSGARNFKGNLKKWNTGNVISALYTFADAVSFDSDISKWNTSSCQSMLAMFQGARKFDHDLHWDVSNVQDLRQVFQGEQPYSQLFVLGGLCMQCAI